MLIIHTFVVLVIKNFKLSLRAMELRDENADMSLNESWDADTLGRSLTSCDHITNAISVSMSHVSSRTMIHAMF